MQTKFVPSLNTTVSRLGFGAMRMPTADGEVDREAVKKMIDAAIASGLTYFDTAYVYHGQKSEDVLRECLVERYPRNSFTVADKIPLWLAETPADVERLFGEELSRLGVDYIDFLLLHGLNAERWEKAKEFGAHEYQLKIKAEGKIRFAGFSFHDKPEVLRKILSEGTWDFVQLQINYFDWDDYARENYEIATEFGVPIVVMEPIRGGALANLAKDVSEPFRKAIPGSTDAQWALRFVASLDNVAVILSGMSNQEQIDQNLETFADIKPLTEEEHQAVNDVMAAIRSKKMIPCTGCRYCMDCPFGVDIPAIFRIYNDYMMFNVVERAKNQYARLVSEGHGADQCVQCYSCASQCPQTIEIPDRLAEIREILEA
ncbi:MAG: aldo/keto reductase [Firmicutes bacterium]|nr:aldo/keto reductase [Bacillota bacterium]